MSGSTSLFIKESLTAAGMPQQQAEVIERFGETLATKQDLRELKTELISEIKSATITTIVTMSALLLALVGFTKFF